MATIAARTDATNIHRKARALLKSAKKASDRADMVIFSISAAPLGREVIR
jgi:hypothetical protein